MYKRQMYQNEDEVLLKSVQGKDASDLEERSARAIDKTDWDWTFKVRISPLTRQLTEQFENLPGEYEIDFLCQRGAALWPIMIDGEVAHFLASWQKRQDEVKDAVINAALRDLGALPVKRVEYWNLNTQARANRYFRQLLI